MLSCRNSLEWGTADQALECANVAVGSVCTWRRCFRLEGTDKEQDSGVDCGWARLSGVGGCSSRKNGGSAPAAGGPDSQHRAVPEGPAQYRCY